MTDALMNAERLLRAAAMLSDDLDGWHSERGESYRAAADALAAERERRGERMMLKVECSHCHHMTNAGLVPLPPATGEGMLMEGKYPSAAADRLARACGPLAPSSTALVSVSDLRTLLAWAARPTPEPSEAMVEAAMLAMTLEQVEAHRYDATGAHTDSDTGFCPVCLPIKLRAALAAQEG